MSLLPVALAFKALELGVDQLNKYFRRRKQPALTAHLKKNKRVRVTMVLSEEHRNLLLANKEAAGLIQLGMDGARLT